MTSAPCSASRSTPSGPAMPQLRSRIRTPSKAPGMTIAPSRVVAVPGARYLTRASACRDRHRECGAEAPAGLDDGRGAAAERVDGRGHRFDGDELPAWRRVQLRVRIAAVERERERSPAGT